jgi:hypothetical protein
MKSYAVILFYSHNYAIWAADVLKKQAIEHKLMPVPRHLSSECGYCVRIHEQDSHRACSLLTDNRIEYERAEALRDS